MPASQITAQYNANRLLRELWLNRGLSRKQLAERLELDKSTVTHMVNRMEKKGILATLSEGNASSRGGRKPLSLGIRGEYAYFLGIEIQPEALVATLVDLEGKIISNETVPLDLRGEGFRREIGENLHNIYSRFSLTYPIMAMGLGFPGMVDPYRGEIINSALHDIGNNCLLETLINPPLPCSVIIENDANCCTWGEIMDNRNRAEENILFLLLETDLFSREDLKSGRFSLGMGFSLKNNVYHGSQFSAGEYLSTGWKGDRKNQFTLDYEDLLRIGKDQTVRQNLFEEISRHTAFLANTLDLDRVCFGGDIGPYWPEMEELMKESLDRHRSYPGMGSCRCTLSRRGKYAVSYGAAVMPLMEVFNPDRQNPLLPGGREGLEDFAINHYRDNPSADTHDGIIEKGDAT